MGGDGPPLRAMDAPTIDAPRGDTHILEGRYVVGTLIARGGMGEVYEGWDRTLGRAVAIKVLSPRLVGDHELRERFRREAEALGRLHHPGIVTVHSVGEDQQRPYFVMARLSGRTLAEEIRARGPLPSAAVVRIGRALASALEHVHTAGFVHRDVKPSNVMIDEDGAATLLDFGVIRADDSSVTASGSVVGTPEFMAPEQARDPRLADRRSDIYALGATLYAAWAGVPPFSGASAYEVIHAHHTAEVPAPSARVAALEPAVDRLIARALAKDPEARFVDARALGDALAALTVGASARTRGRVRRGWALAMGAVVVAGVGAWGLAGERARGGGAEAAPRADIVAAGPELDAPHTSGASPPPSAAASRAVNAPTGASLDAPTGPSLGAPTGASLATPAPRPSSPPAARVPSPSIASPPPSPARAPAAPATLRIVTLDRGLATWATVTVDDGSALATPIAGLDVAAGDHTLVVQRAGYHPKTVRFTVAAGEKKKLEIEIEPMPPE